MKISVAKYLLSALLTALLLSAAKGFGYSRADGFLPETEICASEFEEAEIGSSCYVDYAEGQVILLDFSGRHHCEEDDGSWGNDAPEGFFSHDHPDDQSMAPLYAWHALPSVSAVISEIVFSRCCMVHPGAVYPPPQP